MRPICILAALIALAGCAYAGPVLDDILNSMYIDQSLARSGDDYLTIAPDKPLGQTFVTGDQTVLICRIALRVAYRHESWQPGESLVLTLWDSPAKKTQLGRFAIPYERRQWSDALLMFAVESKVEPKHGYYFELTVDGGDGKIHGILLAKIDPAYASGTGYEGGKPVDRDIWFETYVKKPVARDAQFTEFFDNFDLGLPALAKVRSAVAAKDWDAACREFLAHMESRRDIMNDEDATPKLRPPKYDPRESDLVADQKWPAQDGSVVDHGPNWNYHASWPTLGGGRAHAHRPDETAGLGLLRHRRSQIRPRVERYAHLDVPQRPVPLEVRRDQDRGQDQADNPRGHLGLAMGLDLDRRPPPPRDLLQPLPPLAPL